MSLVTLKLGPGEQVWQVMQEPAVVGHEILTDFVLPTTLLLPSRHFEPQQQG